MTQIAGVDYSAGWPGAVALKQAGKVFIHRYLTYDWRGLKRDELADAQANGIEVAVVYETTELRPLSGFAGGAYDAAVAQSILVDLGLPATQVIYFACDWDFSTAQLPAIREYFRGVMSVIGYARTGIYGGYTVIANAEANKYASWFWETLAWQYGRGVHPMTTLYQWGFTDIINGVDCDQNTAFAENYGQASKAIGTAPEVPVPDIVPPIPETPEPPKYAKPKLPKGYARINARKNPSQMIVNGDHWYPIRGNVEALDTTGRYSEPGPSDPAGPKVQKGEKIGVDWMFKRKANGKKFYANSEGFYRASSFTPDMPFPERRPAKP